MRRLISSLGITTILTGLLIFGCQSQVEKFDIAESKLFNQDHDMNAVNAANIKANSIEDDNQRIIFLHMTEVKIKSNEDRIAGLKKKRKLAGNSFDVVSWELIDSLELKNKEMKAAKEAYEQSQNDGLLFQREFTSTLDALTQAIKDGH